MRVYKKYFIFCIFVLLAVLTLFLSEKVAGCFNTSKTIELNKTLFKKNFIASDKFVVKRVKKIKVSTEAEKILYADSSKVIEGSKEGKYSLIDLNSGKTSLYSFSSMGFEMYGKKDSTTIKQLLNRIKRLNFNEGIKTTANQVFFVTDSDDKILDDATINLSIECYVRKQNRMIWQEERIHKNRKDSFNSVQKFTFLNNKDLLTLKELGNYSEIAIYDLNREDFTRTVKNNVLNFALSQDKKKIAYLTADEKGEQVIYVGRLKNNKIVDKWILYKTFSDITDMSWSSDEKELYLNIREDSHKNIVYQYLLGR